jgi:hypothetical protein
VSRPHANEERRWLRVLSVPFYGASAAVALSLATGWIWPMGLSIALGPGLGIFALTYLAISSDCAGDAVESVEAEAEIVPFRRAA